MSSNWAAGRVVLDWKLSNHVREGARVCVCVCERELCNPSYIKNFIRFEEVKAPPELGLMETVSIFIHTYDNKVDAWN